MQPHSHTGSTPTGYRHDDVVTTSMLRISVIVPCYSMERVDDMLRLLESVERQSCPPYELIAVVQQSEALRTALESRLAVHRAADWRILFLEGNPGVSKARNAGVEQSSGDVIAFVDDDAVLSDDWVEKTGEAYLHDATVVGIAGAIAPLWDRPEMAWFPGELYWMVSCTYWDSAVPMRVRNGYGANISFRSEAFSNGRRFNESLGIGPYGSGGWRGVGGEEPEFSVRVVRATGKQILFVPAVKVWHRVRPYRLALRTIARRAYWEGRFKALLAASADSEHDVLQTEHALLQILIRNGLRRIPSLLVRPHIALRQQFTVTLVLICVATGYVEGRIRRIH